jgi:hypothetical protein
MSRKADLAYEMEPAFQDFLHRMLLGDHFHAAEKLSKEARLVVVSNMLGWALGEVLAIGCGNGPRAVLDDCLETAHQRVAEHAHKSWEAYQLEREQADGYRQH